MASLERVFHRKIFGLCFSVSLQPHVALASEADEGRKVRRLCDPACEFSGRLPASPPSVRSARLDRLGPVRVADVRGAPGKGVSLSTGPLCGPDVGPWGALGMTSSDRPRGGMLPLVPGSEQARSASPVG